MYSIGSLFYAIYFFVSFPAFYAMDEYPRQRWTLLGAARDALAAGMAVTILLDLWRLGIGPLQKPAPANPVGQLLGPWVGSDSGGKMSWLWK